MKDLKKLTFETLDKMSDYSCEICPLTDLCNCQEICQSIHRLLEDAKEEGVSE